MKLFEIDTDVNVETEMLQIIEQVESRKDEFDGIRAHFYWDELRHCNFILIQKKFLHRTWVMYYRLPRCIDVLQNWSIVWSNHDHKSYCIHSKIVIEDHKIPPHEPIRILNRFHTFLRVEWRRDPSSFSPIIGFRSEGVVYNLEKQAKLRQDSTPWFRHYPKDITTHSIDIILLQPIDLRFFEPICHTIEDIRCRTKPQRHVVSLATKKHRMHKIVFQDHPFVNILLEEECDEYPCSMRLVLSS